MHATTRQPSLHRALANSAWMVLFGSCVAANALIALFVLATLTPIVGASWPLATSIAVQVIGLAVTLWVAVAARDHERADITGATREHLASISSSLAKATRSASPRLVIFELFRTKRNEDARSRLAKELPNAFAVEAPGRMLIGVTPSFARLVEQGALDQRMVEAVFLHEFGHLRYNHVYWAMIDGGIGMATRMAVGLCEPALGRPAPRGARDAGSLADDALCHGRPSGDVARQHRPGAGQGIPRPTVTPSRMPTPAGCTTSSPGTLLTNERSSPRCANRRCCPAASAASAPK
jgi:Zn-dependent protease with chaperone function